MDNHEARTLLGKQMTMWRGRSYAELRELVGSDQRFDVVGCSGTRYQGDVQVVWDAAPDGAIRVMASIDDGGWRAFVPIVDDFIRAPDGTFVGE